MPCLSPKFVVYEEQRKSINEIKIRTSFQIYKVHIYPYYFVLKYFQSRGSITNGTKNPRRLKRMKTFTYSNSMHGTLKIIK